MNEWEHAEEARYQANADRDRFDGWDTGDLNCPWAWEEPDFIGPIQQIECLVPYGDGLSVPYDDELSF